MFTPQQIEQISFGQATFGGYNTDDVDAFLEPLTEDYITLYKENALLKSKMRVLVSKLEDYRKNETSMKAAIAEAQATCDKMVAEAESRCAQMLGNASAAAETKNSTDIQIAAEQQRLADARRMTITKIDEIEEQMRACIVALERIKRANQSTASKPAASTADDVAAQISQSLAALVGTTDERHPKPEPMHPTHDATTTKFANLQFGRNYDPTQR